MGRITRAEALRGLAGGAFGVWLGNTRKATADPALESKVAEVLPTRDEDRWLQIPWRTNVMEALAEAQKAGKPVLLWVMNGNPLGCA